MNITERLRKRNVPFGWPELADKAADEIERLTAIIENVALAIGHTTSPLLKE